MDAVNKNNWQHNRIKNNDKTCFERLDRSVVLHNVNNSSTVATHFRTELPCIVIITGNFSAHIARAPCWSTVPSILAMLTVNNMPCFVLTSTFVVRWMQIVSTCAGKKEGKDDTFAEHDEKTTHNVFFATTSSSFSSNPPR
eukprot:2541772-Ditylum_brightwellii.AAC.1